MRIRMVRSGRTEEEKFDKLMVDFTRIPGVPRRIGLDRGFAVGGVKKEGRVNDWEPQSQPEPTPELETQTAAVPGSVYLVDRENSRHRQLMQILQVPDDGNCFWAAFASAFYGDASQWAKVKLQTLSYFRSVKRNANHPRHGLYQTLDDIAAQDGSGVENQLRGNNIWTSAETTQVVADLFNVELVIVFKLDGNPNMETVFRGLRNRQQVFLYLKNVHWVGLRPFQVYPSDFRWEYHAGKVDCRSPVMEHDGTFEVPRALLPCPRIPEVSARDVKRLVGAVGGRREWERFGGTVD